MLRDFVLADIFHYNWEILSSRKCVHVLFYSISNWETVKDSEAHNISSVHILFTKPCKPLSLSPCPAALNYGQEIFKLTVSDHQKT